MARPPGRPKKVRIAGPEEQLRTMIPQRLRVLVEEARKPIQGYDVKEIVAHALMAWAELPIAQKIRLGNRFVEWAENRLEIQPPATIAGDGDGQHAHGGQPPGTVRKPRKHRRQRKGGATVLPGQNGRRKAG
jgi:hypothetical protein